MSRVLVVEDEADLATVLEYSLRQAGHTVQTTSSGKDGLLRAAQWQPELIMLDLMLPDMGGAEVCRQLKRASTTRHIPVMMVTARGEEIDRVVGLELGAEDYVVKPFSVRELLLRVGVVLRRGQAPEAPAMLELGVLRVDTAAHRVTVDGANVHLTPMEFRLLTTLMNARDNVQTRAVLLDRVWGMAADINTRTVDTHVKRLRQKLGAAGAFIHSVRGVGYRFATRPDDLWMAP
jgi:two-component system phosphate regulon response regulator PhoB